MFNKMKYKTIPGCVTNMVRALEWESLKYRRKTNANSIKYRTTLTDIDRNQYLTFNYSRRRDQHKFYHERTSNDTYGN